MTERVGFTEVLIDMTRKVKRIPQSEYLASGQIPVIDQSQEFCAGYYAEFNDAFEKVPAIVFGDHTRCVKYVDRPFVAGADGVKVLLCKRKEDNPKYFYYALKAANVPSLGYSRHFKLVKALTFADATRERQEAIVARLDSLEQLIAERHAEIDRLDELVKSRFVEMFGNPMENAKGYPIMAFSECCINLHQGINTAADKVEYKPEGYPIVQSKNITKGYLDLEDVRYLGFEDYEKYRHRYNPHPNDLLLCNIGTIGDTLIIEKEYRFVIAWNLFMIQLDTNVLNAIYTKSFLELLNENHYYERFLTGGTVKFVSKKTIGSIPTIVPPLENQICFADFVRQVDKSRFAVQQAIEQLELLKAKLMQEYFG